MGTRKITPFDTHLRLMSKESLDQVIYRKMAFFISSCWFFFTSFLFFVIGFVAQLVFRSKEENSQRAIKENSKRLETVAEATELEEREFDISNKEEKEEKEEEETSSFSFKFSYQIPEVNPESKEEPMRDAAEENFPRKAANISNYSFLSERDFSGIIEEPQAMTFRVHESYIGFCEKNDLEKSNMKFGDVMPSKDQNLGEDEIKPMSFVTKSLGEREISEGFLGSESDSDSMSVSDGYSVKDLVVDSDTDGFLSEKDFGDSEIVDSIRHEVEQKKVVENFDKGQSSNSSRGLSDIRNETNFEDFCDGFLSERGFDEPEKDSKEKLHEVQNTITESFSISNENYIGRESQLEDTLSKIESFEHDSDSKAGEIGETQLPNPSTLRMELVDSSDDSRNINGSLDPETKTEDSELKTEFGGSNANKSSLASGTNEADYKEPEEDSKKTEEDTEKTKEGQLEDLGTEELDELESLWEHQDLIEQLRMELKKVRAAGLPTILEESESPKTIEDLKPWKIDEKFLREDPMDELHKFYKSYRERMRKFDILNYQKMHAMGFLQLKNPLESIGSNKPLMSTLISHLSQNLRAFGRRKSSSNPSEKFIKELQNDLETVYVGQTCLSWEFLRWQYEKARELPDSDAYRRHQYNQVASEFQQFQVIVQRFIENESFQGPRLPNYVKSRCVLRNLLQVPVISEDCWKDKMEDKRKGKYDAITSEMLEDIMEESIRVFWEFVKADKDETSGILKGLIGNQVEVQDPSDYELLDDVQANLQKKEKKLKDIMKTGNCIVKKFKKPREDRSNQDLFFSQVDIKLVSRVLKMSRITTDQLVWCHKKLHKINFSERKIRREPSFLLFPC